MNLAITARAAACVLAGLFLILAGAAGPAPQQTRPKPVTTWRPATELERRDADRQLLVEQLDRMWQQRQHPDHRRQDLP